MRQRCALILWQHCALITKIKAYVSIVLSGGLVIISFLPSKLHVLQEVLDLFQLEDSDKDQSIPSADDEQLFLSLQGCYLWYYLTLYRSNHWIRWISSTFDFYLQWKFS